MGFLPLAGIRVLDVTTSLAGPYCTAILSSLGAEVVKVEPPGGGDEARTWGPPFHEGTATMFLSANPGKRSLALRLRQGSDVLLRLADRADVFVQSLRPGLADELGLGREALRARNPRLVYVSINAFGRTGPWAGRPGYDPLAQAATGIISVTGEPERPGVRVGVSLIDQGTGTWAALGTLAALLERATTGEGRAVDVSLYETALGLVAYHVTGYLAEGRVPGRHGTAFPAIAPYETFPTADGELMVAAGNDRLFAALVEALGVPGLAAEARFATNPDRVANRAALRELLLPRFAGLTRAEVLARLEAAGVPAAPVQDVGEVARHEQTAAIGILQQLGTLQTLGLPLQFDDARLIHRSPPPRLGEHTAEVLAEAGYTPAEIAELAASGTIALG